MRKLAAMTLLAFLAGCGQTGPLYLPGAAPVENETPTAAEPSEPSPVEPADPPASGAS
jgi:predicted small lipoprotein YifL